jgi:hypothetical protein
MRSGGSLDDIEAWLEDDPFECDLDGLELSSEQKAALWLYGWSLLPKYQQRARATAWSATAPASPTAASAPSSDARRASSTSTS